MQNNENSCAVCGSVANQKCSGCQITYYCTREHQKSDWKTHSKICRACKLVENAQIGRHYVATRNIKIGETVIHDKAPLVTGPHYPICQTSNGDIIKYITPVCLNCYNKLTIANAKPCQKCGWPLCNKCDKHGNECEFTVKYRKTKMRITNYNIHQPIYETIMVIRALALKDTNPEAYRKLLNHEYHCNEIATQPKLFMQPKQVAKIIKSFFNIKHIEDEEIAKIFGIIKVNGAQITTMEPTHSAVYDAASYIEHNCRPNCSTSSTDEGGLIIWAVVPISKGDHITTSYLPFPWGTVKRRNFLAITKFFECECERCKDPTEFQTMFNALKCYKSACDGLMLPPTFLVTGGNYPDFVCSKCSATMPWKLVKRTDAIICKQRASINTSDISDYEKSLAKWKKVLHENHFHIIETEIALAYELGLRGSDLTDRTDKSLTDLVMLCTKLTKLIQTLAPAENQLRGVLLFIHFKANEVLFTRNVPDNFDKQFEFVKESKEMLDEIYQLLHREPTSCSLENSIALYVLDEIIKVESSVELLRTLIACSM